jgi:putative permease
MLGGMLAPVLASMVIAFLLEGPVAYLERLFIPRIFAVIIVCLAFVAFLLFLVLGLLPVLSEQISQFFQQLPTMITRGQRELLRLPEQFPGFISDQLVIDFMGLLRSELSLLGHRILSQSVASLRGLFAFFFFIFLMPLLVFFLLKDKIRILTWVAAFLPEDRSLTTEVWHEVNRQIGNYARGKFFEIIIVGSASYITFRILGLDYAILISLFVGLSVLIPYFGAIFMTFPVASIAFFEWGLGSQFAYTLIAYFIIQILDGNVLVALLFSEVVNLHPVAIIVAVLVFGGTLGFWGVFFAIPLATLVQAILGAWARNRRKNYPTSEREDNAPGDPASENISK